MGARAWITKTLQKQYYFSQKSYKDTGKNHIFIIYRIKYQ